MQDTQNLRRSNKAYGKSQLTGLPGRAPRYARPQLDSKTGIPKMAQFDHYRQFAGYYLSELTGCDQVW